MRVDFIVAGAMSDGGCLWDQVFFGCVSRSDPQPVLGYWEGVNGSLLQNFSIIWGMRFYQYRKLQNNFRFPWDIFSILICAKTSVAYLAPTKAMPVHGCRQKQSIDWTEHISKQDNVSLDFLRENWWGNDNIYPHCCISNIVPLFSEISSLEEA